MFIKQNIIAILLICVHFSYTTQDNGFVERKEIWTILNRIKRSIALDYNTRSIPPTIQGRDRIVVTVPEQRPIGYPTYPMTYRNNNAPTVVINVPDENYPYSSRGYNVPYAGVPPAHL